jgi:hypothetical protein
MGGKVGMGGKVVMPLKGVHWWHHTVISHSELSTQALHALAGHDPASCYCLHFAAAAALLSKQAASLLPRPGGVSSSVLPTGCAQGVLRI